MHSFWNKNLGYAKFGRFVANSFCHTGFLKEEGSFPYTHTWKQLQKTSSKIVTEKWAHSKQAGPQSSFVHVHLGLIDFKKRE
jgi:hypothetical protein